MRLTNQEVAAMETFHNIQELHIIRFTFLETLSGEFIAMTGYGIYVYLTPVDIDQLFNHFLNHDTPIRKFARQCVKDTLRLALEKRSERG
jgi:hypothetical protein